MISFLLFLALLHQVLPSEAKNAASLAAEKPPGAACMDYPAIPAAPELYLPDLLLRDSVWTLSASRSVDGKWLAFVQWQYPAFSPPDSNIQRLYISSLDTSGKWSAAVEAPGFTNWRVDQPHFSPDGRWLYLASTRTHPGQYRWPNPPYEDFDLWRIPLDKSTGEPYWHLSEVLPCEAINQQKNPDNWRIGYVNNETGPKLDHSGRLYFWTERLGSKGQRDLFEVDAFGQDCQQAIPRPLPFNTPQFESGIAISSDGNTAYFSSEGLGSRRNADLYMSQRNGNGWTAPKPLPAAVNSPYDEGSPELIGDTVLLFTSSRPIDAVLPPATEEGRFWQMVWSIRVADL